MIGKELKIKIEERIEQFNWAAISAWHDELEKALKRAYPPPRMGNRYDARSAPKKIKAWRDDWEKIKVRDARKHQCRLP